MTVPILLRLTVPAFALVTPLVAQDVPLELWTNSHWPQGLKMGSTACGPSWGDHDADGWVDFFMASPGKLYINQGGQDWKIKKNIIAPGVSRYGAAFGDYNNDGLPDLATEPRNALGLEMLKNLGGGSFENVALDPNIIDNVPVGYCETNCWLDADFDGNLDLFVPGYPEWVGSRGNFFLYNLGPVGLGGEYHFTELSAAAGLDNPPGTFVPEGAEFCDVDGDGDLDGYSNGTLYQNVSQPGVPLFRDISRESGIELRRVLDEGCAFLDYDMDGDFDLVVAYCNETGTRIYENDGDGSFTLIAREFVEEPEGCLGFSKADWDNDGDIDITTGRVFRKNVLMETGRRGYVVASHNLLPMVVAMPAWCDWDRDGDLDCALGNYSVGHFYENVLYGPATRDSDRRYVRVRVVRDSSDVAGGLETEYGAAVEIRLEDDAPRNLRRRSFVSSASGYLTQNEYTLHFALPPDPDPADASVDVVFDVEVDFNSDPRAGLHQVDRYVNPALGRIHLTDLKDREIVVFRSGRVIIGDCTFAPVPGNDPVLTATTDGLALAGPAAPLLDPVPVPGSDWYVGLAFDTVLATIPVRVKEVLLDGVVATSPGNCGGDVRMTLWDTTDSSNPFIVAGGSLDLARYPRNDRNVYPTDMLLAPGREYRLVARVDELRASVIGAPLVNGPITVAGGLSFRDMTPCEGSDVVAAAVDASQAYLSLRFAEDAGPMWVDLGHSLAGTLGAATLAGSGAIEPASTVTLTMAGAPTNQLTVMVLGTSPECLELAGGILFPSPDRLIPLVTDATGGWSWSAVLPADLPRGTTIYFQVWWADPGAAMGRAASNALSATSPF